MLAVGIIEVDVAQGMARGGEDDDPGVRRYGELRNKQAGEFEVPEMVCSDLDLKAI